MPGGVMQQGQPPGQLDADREVLARRVAALEREAATLAADITACAGMADITQEATLRNRAQAVVLELAQLRRKLEGEEKPAPPALGAPD
jgi:hypothetical protein